jgi:hypothetical protein
MRRWRREHLHGRGYPTADGGGWQMRDHNSYGCGERHLEQRQGAGRDGLTRPPEGACHSNRVGRLRHPGRKHLEPSYGGERGKQGEVERIGSGRGFFLNRWGRKSPPASTDRARVLLPPLWTGMGQRSWRSLGVRKRLRKEIPTRGAHLAVTQDCTGACP